MDPKHLRELIIRPTLKLYGRWNPAAEELLMLTAAVETQLGYYLKQGAFEPNDHDGVALGIYQMEPKTFAWIQSRFSELTGRDSMDLIWDLKLATIACRLRYFVDPVPLPDSRDIEGLAKTWKRVYNSVSGAGRWEDAELAYRRLVK